MSSNEEYKNVVAAENTQLAEQSQAELGMKWFKFLIYFGLFFASAEDLIQSAALIFDIRNDFIDLDYYFVGNLRWLGILFAVAWIITAVIGIYMRFSLANFKKDAPKKYIIFEIVNRALSLIYTLVGIFLVTDSEMYITVGSVIGSVVSCVVGGAIYIYLNIIYFKKRNHLFVN